MRRKLFTYPLLFLLLLLSACEGNVEKSGEQAEDSEDRNETENEAGPADTAEAETEEETENEGTITGTEAIAFDKADDEKVVRIVLEELDIPFDANSARYHLYYGDNTFVSIFTGEGAFAYDLNNSEVIWEKEGRVNDHAVHENTLYIEENNPDIRHVYIEALSFDDGEVVEIYENQEMRGAVKLQALDDYILYQASSIDDPDGYLFFQIMNKETRETVEIPVIGSDEFSKVELEDGILVTNARETEERDSSPDTDHFVNVDKETGERIYQVEASAGRDTPVRNEHAVYYLNYDRITGFDLNGEYFGEIEMTYPQSGLIIPIATEDALIARDMEGIAWYEADLSSEKHRVNVGGEDSEVYEMQATKDRIFAVIGEGDESRDEKDFYVVELDIDTGEIYEKIDLGITYDANPVLSNYSYQDKVYFSMIDLEERRVDFVFSNSGVHQPFEE